VGTLVVFAACLCAPIQADTADGAALAPRVRIKDSMAARAVRLSVAGAVLRLQDPGCRAILAEFRSPSGRLLEAELDARQQTAHDHLASLLFYDGSEQRACGRSGVLAATEPGSQVVFICARAFTRTQTRDFVEGELLLIHEMLHTLGLAENPPSSSEINARVEARCRSAR
jgi:hypothetical protein